MLQEAPPENEHMSLLVTCAHFYVMGAPCQQEIILNYLISPIGEWRGRMESLWIRDIGGLYHELFDMDVNTPLTSSLKIKGNYLDASNYFWGKLFKRERIITLIDIMRMNLHSEFYSCPQYLAINENVEAFLNKIIDAPTRIHAANISPQEFFSELEAITILCKLYSDFEYAPFQLSLQDGFVLEASSSQDIFEKSLNPTQNPYLHFVHNEIIPIIIECSPNVIFLSGRVSYYLMAISLSIKKYLPNVHICLTRHSSEYYSMNKICNLLAQNSYLYRMVDSVILEYFDFVEPQVTNAVLEQKSLNEVPNLLFRDFEDSIIKTVHMLPDDTKQMYIGNILNRQSCNLVDIHIEPFKKCHWNKCTFCGINQKYNHKDCTNTVGICSDKISRLKELSLSCDAFWSIDEAISIEQLRIFAHKLLDAGVNMIWQARCRFDVNLLKDGLPELLAKAGLRELRIGLESASYFVLKLMNKFENDFFTLELMEKLIETYHKYGISIHCPMIIGFPQEDRGERQKTYEFLSHMKESSSSFSFNLNILNLDISSELYKEWATYRLQRLEFPCPPQYFLGNTISWIDENEHWVLNHERQQFMREQLFPWMPTNSLMMPTIFYRLSENSRNTLIWKSNNTLTNSQYFSPDIELNIAPNLVFVWETIDRCLIYNWRSHHYMHGNRHLIELLKHFEHPSCTNDVINSLTAQNPLVYSADQLLLLIQKLFLHAHLVISN